MPLTRCQYWIFDMDGTLTRPVHDFSFIREKIGIEEGLPILEAIANMPQDKAEVVTRRLNEIEMEIAYQAVAQPGAESLLEQLKERGCRLGILTRNGEDIARVTLSVCGLERFFRPEMIVGRETCAPKPRPDGVLHLLNLWNAQKDETVIVGDYRYDIEAGYRSGIKTVHLDHSGLFEWPEFMHHGIRHLDQLPPLFRGASVL